MIILSMITFFRCQLNFAMRLLNLSLMRNSKGRCLRGQTFNLYKRELAICFLSNRFCLKILSITMTEISIAQISIAVSGIWPTITNSTPKRAKCTLIRSSPGWVKYSSKSAIASKFPSLSRTHTGAKTMLSRKASPHTCSKSNQMASSKSLAFAKMNLSLRFSRGELL